ncbi:MAG: DUF1538 domain-containing protein [Acholeplasmatales bacterium]|nr:DUF1538 domain-containing protein [Acholeplasmatales bacterium]
MLKVFLEKLKESAMSVLPVTLIVLILSFTPLAKLDGKEQIVFGVCALLLIVGISLFSLGVDFSMSDMGEQVGSSLVKTKKIFIILLVAFIMGLLITIAEPDLSVLAGQIKGVFNGNKWILIISIALGVGIFLLLAVLKMITKTNLSMMLLFFYMAMFAVTALLIELGNSNFLAISFDSGGVTTGPITVPFIMALGVGIAATVGGRDSKENSFGLIALCSVGPILVVLLLGLTINSSNLGPDIITSDLESYKVAGNVVVEFFKGLLEEGVGVLVALALIVAVFLVINFIFIKLPKVKLARIGVGLAITYVGLVIFLTAAKIGFLPIGYKLGSLMAENKTALAIFGFVLGMVVVLAEPAVHVLTKQVEEVTIGAIKKRTMLIALCIGVAISIMLAMIRIIFNFSLLYYIIPGYLISLGLAFFVPSIYTGIAFDSGGVASGPLTSSFILPFAIGACISVNGLESENLLGTGFGIVAMVAMTPLITIQLLGFKSVVQRKVVAKHRLKTIISSDDEQIINFM